MCGPLAQLAGTRIRADLDEIHSICRGGTSSRIREAIRPGAEDP